MLTTLLAWIYISFLCWMWGILVLRLINKTTKNELRFPHFGIICLAGLSAITVFASILSLMIPLGTWWVQFLFIVPCLVLFFKQDSPSFFAALKNEFQSLHRLSKILLYACLLLILVMTTWTVIHPDTLGYHAQTIQWIEKYKAIPGLVHLHVRFGYQGLWFDDCALFGFSFTGIQGITFLNSTAISWFLIFVINRINYHFFINGKKAFGLLWMALFFLCMWSYTQVRLTATSASPDFIATIFICTIIYLLLEKEQNRLGAADWMLITFLALVAVTIKLSVAPILLIAAVATLFFLVKRKIKLSFTILIISVIILAPFVARNIITSGYVAFPSTYPDIADVDWKYSRSLTASEKDYITAYAKKQGVVEGEITIVNKMKATEWIPVWWKNRSVADQCIIMLLLSSFLAALLSAKKVIRSGFIPKVALLTMLAGIIFWFMTAPDPRFGFGFILGFIGTIVYLIFKEKDISVTKNASLLLLSVTLLLILIYTGYRFMNFFKQDQLLTPLGIEKNEYSSFECDGIKVNSPPGGKDFGITPIPCTDLGCEKFSLRGDNIENGFRAK